ncbi:type I restriction-modification system subunit M [Methylobacterium nodulans]|uniref:Methyltransferase n=1 Tax=Methylobacterium nodulans (strain LMG 21967 / CNCM I-2342 / ORS 2060) TaxID=460265 RepID=B8IAN3_METNO|nr:type I restriction-modification system subunit M [Methylobacterium nodulans]ACL61078.1 conserved hypothetical protein [Methylobacterium nodulans ORS 2060]
MKTRDARAVMASRREPPTALDFFPTPPWATRALCELLRERGVPIGGQQVWDPACGEGHMAGPLADYFRHVEASDVFDYGRGYRVTDFLDPAGHADRPDWIITNPPFSTSLEFALIALPLARVGVALLVRTSWLEGGERYAKLFGPTPPSLVAQFCERVPMTRGRWDPAATTATSYTWVVWRTMANRRPKTEFTHLPPGTRARCARPDDALRYGVQADAPLLTLAGA